MQKTLCLILLCLLFSEVVSQNTTVSNNTGKTVVSGYLPFSTDAETTVALTIWNSDDIKSFQNNVSVSSSKGHFKFNLAIDNIKMISLTIGDNDLMGSDSIGSTGNIMLLEPFDSIHLHIPAVDSRIPAVVFSGKGSEKQKIINSINLDLKKLLQSEPVKKLSYTSIEDQIDLSMMIRKVIHYGLDENAARLSEAACETLRVRMLGVDHYAVLQSFLSADLADVRIISLYNDKYLKLYNDRDLIVSDQLGGASWPDVLESRAILDYLIHNKESNPGAIKKDKRKLFDILLNFYKDHPQKSKILATYLSIRVHHKGVNDDVNYMADVYFNNIPGDDAYKKKLADVLQSLRLNLTSRTKAFDFVLYDSAGNEIALHDFKGKVVVLDFMFNGCGGCYVLRPVMEKFEREFHNEDVVFVSIAADKTMKQFKKGIGKFSSKSSIHLYTNGKGFDHPILQHYGIVVYPTLVVIDKNGFLINGRAPSPLTNDGWKDLELLIKSGL